MKTYAVTLSIKLTALVHAEQWVMDEKSIRFLKKGAEVALYAKPSIAKIEDCTSGAPCPPEYVARASARL
jgi:hypothetical protein